MSTAASTTAAFDRAVAPVLSVLSREQAAKIAGFHADAELQARIEELAEKANEGELTEDERAEYEGYSRANHFIAVLQAQARGMVDSTGNG
jgi:uncharacterized protein YnzC (UPF0291/DUF896 family)